MSDAVSLENWPYHTIPIHATKVQRAGSSEPGGCPASETLAPRLPGEKPGVQGTAWRDAEGTDGLARRRGYRR